ncbi:UDP-glycosyltransferase 82A1 [Hibiscus syriacus]|uniref:Glycosyltransferase n=1 Tax=Hibiscus syriacus TaxID=106335 RepID=A0A6A2ZGK8_HIBSY|nr:UDP-glycosyltransferase 82A1-like [Hibiscus syriacus]KAE8690115.1 UDP-glycosyltransferase 82A1 [Hibiscus syriacus]
MGVKCNPKRPKILLVPYPAQGHVNPMLKLGLSFVSHGFEPIVVTPEFIHHRIAANLDPHKGEVRFVSIPDGLDGEKGPLDFFSIEKSMENVMPIYLESLLRKFDEDEGKVVCLVIDLLASWAIQVAERCGIPAAGFWPAMQVTYRLITAIPEMIHSDLISETGCPRHQGTVLSLPSQPLLSTEDLPWLIGTQASRKARLKFWTRTLERSTTLPWLLINSFPREFIDEYEADVRIAPPHASPIVFPVGPLTKPSLTTVKNPSFWKEDTNCLDWLNHHESNSVIYVSFGSWVSPVGDAKIKTLALTLESLNRPFIWVLAESWRQGLPNGYSERVSKQGKLVSWAPQLQILRHKAVGVYITHCGWNSTMEAIQCRKRLLCYPVAGDQFVNCKYIVKVWKIGVRLNGLELKDVEEAVRKVTEDEEMEGRLMKIYQRTMGEEASSSVMGNLKAFIFGLNQVQHLKDVKTF